MTTNGSIVLPLASQRFPTLTQLREIHIKRAITLCRGNTSGARILLGMSKTSMHRWVRKNPNFIATFHRFQSGTETVQIQ